MKKNIQWIRRRENYQRRDGVGILLPLGGGLAPSFRGHWGESNSGLDDGTRTRFRLGACIQRKHNALRSEIKGRFLPRFEGQCGSLARNALVIAALTQA